MFAAGRTITVIVIAMMWCGMSQFADAEGPNYLPAQAAQAPPGFQWIQVPGLYATLLMPEGWHRTDSQGKLMSSVSLSENKPSAGQYSARLTINAVSNLTQTNYQLVSQQLKQYAERLSATPNVSVLTRQAIKRGPYTGEAIALKYNGDSIATGAERSVVEYRHYLANDSRDWLLVITFHCNSADALRLQSVREQMLGSYHLQ